MLNPVIARLAKIWRVLWSCQSIATPIKIKTKTTKMTKMIKMTAKADGKGDAASAAAPAFSTEATVGARVDAAALASALALLEVQHAATKRTNMALQHELDEIKARAMREQHERKLLRVRVERLQTRNDAVQRELKISAAARSRVIEEKAALEQQVGTFGTDRSRLATERWAGQRTLTALKAENKRLECELQAAKDKTEEEEQAAKDTVKEEKHVTEHAWPVVERAVASTPRDEAAANRRMDELSKDNLVLSSGVAMLTIKHRALKTELADVQAQLSSLKSENGRLEDQSRGHQARVVKLKKAAEALTASNVEAQLQLATVTAEKARLEAETATTISKLVTENAALQRQLTDRVFKASIDRELASPSAKRRRSVECLGALTTPRAQRFVARKRLHF
jgi:chromosome segregation ATPase